MTAPCEHWSVSVVIPVFNRATTIGDAIRSVQSQTIEFDEIVVVDDGSTDDTATVVAALAAADRRIRLVRQANGGAASARNAGITVAHGDWIAFLDSDDAWRPTKLAHAHELARADATIEFIHSDRSLRKGSQLVEAGRATRADLSSRDALLSDHAIKTSTVVIARSLLRRLERWFPTTMATCEDYELFWRAVAAAHTIGYVPTSDTVVELGDDGLSRRRDRRAPLVDNLTASLSAMRWVASRRLPARYTALLSDRAYRDLHELVAYDLRRGAVVDALMAALRNVGPIKPKAVLRAFVSAALARRAAGRSAANLSTGGSAG